MRLGLVRFLNARPLDHGFRRDLPAESLMEDTPARLVEALLDGRLDAALISSVECLRNQDRLDYYPGVGVCTREEVRSILFFTRTGQTNLAELERVYVDRGSRSSVALLEILLEQATGRLPAFEESPPGDIPERVRANPGSAGLLIGDSALDFRSAPDFGDFNCRDLARWWYESESLPFVFALWAYPRQKPIDGELFERSLDHGLDSLPRIAAEFDYPDGLEYLRDVLHYRLDERDRISLKRFETYLLRG